VREKVDPIIEKILSELSECYYPTRCVDGEWKPGLHSVVDETAYALGCILFGVPQNFVQMDSLGFRTCGLFPDAVAHSAVQLDKTILNRSKTFKDFYADALRATVKLMDDAKYKTYMDWQPAIRSEFESVINEIHFAPMGN
jgi:hypothetical protein